MHLEFAFIFLHCIFFKFFYRSINKPNIHDNTIGILRFQNKLNDLFSSTGFYVKSKVREGSDNGKNMFFNFGALLLKMCCFEVVAFFFSPSGYPIKSIFQ